MSKDSYLYKPYFLDTCVITFFYCLITVQYNKYIVDLRILIDLICTNLFHIYQHKLLTYKHKWSVGMLYLKI